MLDEPLDTVPDRFGLIRQVQQNNAQQVRYTSHVRSQFDITKLSIEFKKLCKPYHFLVLWDIVGRKRTHPIVSDVRQQLC